MSAVATGAENTPSLQTDFYIIKAEWIRLKRPSYFLTMFDSTQEYVSVSKAMPGRPVKIRVSTRNYHLCSSLTISVFEEGTENTIQEFTVRHSGVGTAFVSEEIEIRPEWIGKKLKIKVVSNAVQREVIGKELEIVPLEFEEVRIKVVDCRTGEFLKNKLVSKIQFKKNNAVIAEESFKRNEAKVEYTTSDFYNVSTKVLKRLKPAITQTEINDNQYTSDWMTHYNDYWNVRTKSGFSNLTQGNPPAIMAKNIIEHYNAHRSTDDAGILKIFIPLPLLDENEIKIEVGFFDFPVVLEALKKDGRSVVRRTRDQHNQKTGFSIVWEGKLRNDGTRDKSTQDTDWGKKFGWMIKNVSQSSEFKVSEEMVVKDDKNDFIYLNGDILSCFYKERNAHFVLLAMQWCQPIWDDVADPDSARSQRSNEKVYVNKKDSNGRWVSGLCMHITSMHTDNSVSSGSFYGFFSNSPGADPRNRKHQGVDLYSGPSGDLPAFAVHGGKLTAREGGDYGYRGNLALGKNGGNPTFHYAHLRAAVTAKDWVMAGEIIQKSGRTTSSSTFFDAKYPSHLHFELINSNGAKVEFKEITTANPPAGAVYTKPTGDNAFLFQGNDYPLILPCQCHYGNSRTVSQCRFSNTDIIKTCFSVLQYPYTNNLLMSRISRLTSSELNNATGLIRFICPHILGTSANKKAQLQAKVKFIHVNHDRFNPSIFVLENGSETSTLNTFFSATLKIDGKLNDADSKKPIRQLVKAYYYCKNGTKINDSDKKIDDTRIGAFIDKYENNIAISSDADYSLINDFYTWFVGISFSKMCLNTTLP